MSEICAVSCDKHGEGACATIKLRFCGCLVNFLSRRYSTNFIHWRFIAALLKPIRRRFSRSQCGGLGEYRARRQPPRPNAARKLC
jgi:hypothetical protein